MARAEVMGLEGAALAGLGKAFLIPPCPPTPSPLHPRGARWGRGRQQPSKGDTLNY